jgi:hypothetical protein
MTTEHINKAMLSSIEEIDLLRVRLSESEKTAARLLCSAESYLVEIERLRAENSTLKAALNGIASLDKKGTIPAVVSYTAHLALNNAS